MFRLVVPLMGLGLCCAAAAGLPAEAPAVTISLGPRDAKATPLRVGFAHTGGGNIDVQQPAADTVVVTMTGVSVAGAHPVCASAAGFDFLLNQEFEVGFADAKAKAAKLSIEARVIGCLRTQKRGQAEIAAAHVSVLAASETVLTIGLPCHAAAAGRNVSVNDKAGPVVKTIAAGTFTLCEEFGINVTHPHSILPCKAASAEFAPDPALDPLWISYWEPFHGASKKDFGFQVVLKVAPD